MLTPDEQDELQRAVQLIAGVVVAKGDQADSMTDTELAALLLDGRWSTVEVHEAARRLTEIDALRAEVERLTEVDRLLALALAKHDERVAEIERLRGLLRRVEPELVPNHDAAEELCQKFGLRITSGLIADIRAALDEKEPRDADA